MPEKVWPVCVGIAGDHIEGINSHGVVSIKHEVIDNNKRVIDSAKPACPEEKIPNSQEYQMIIKEIRKELVVRDRSSLHVILAATSAWQEVVKQRA